MKRYSLHGQTLENYATILELTQERERKIILNRTPRITGPHIVELLEIRNYNPNGRENVSQNVRETAK